jgi:hypothetical protein
VYICIVIVPFTSFALASLDFVRTCTVANFVYIMQCNTYWFIAHRSSGIQAHASSTSPIIIYCTPTVSSTVFVLIRYTIHDTALLS